MLRIADVKQQQSVIVVYVCVSVCVVGRFSNPFLNEKIKPVLFTPFKQIKHNTNELRKKRCKWRNGENNLPGIKLRQ